MNKNVLSKIISIQYMFYEKTIDIKNYNQRKIRVST